MQHCFSYPLAPAPPALADYNGDMFHTDKSKLANLLKSMVKPSTSTSDDDVFLADGFHFLRTLGVIPHTFGKISELILRKLCVTNANEVLKNVIFDPYLPSIKDPERQRRQIQDIPFQILGPTQNR